MWQIGGDDITSQIQRQIPGENCSVARTKFNPSFLWNILRFPAAKLEQLRTSAQFRTVFTHKQALYFVLLFADITAFGALISHYILSLGITAYN